MMRALGIAGLVLALAGCAVDPATQQRIETLEQQNQQLTEQMQRQRRLLSGLDASGLGNQTASLSDEMREMRGQIERLRFELERNDKRQRELYLDTDKRLRRLEGGGAAAPTAQAEPAPVAPRLDESESAAYKAAFAQLKSGNYDKAIADFGAYLEAYPDSAFAGNAQYWIGEAYYVQREFSDALQAFANVGKKYPRSLKVPDAMLKQGYVLIEQKQIESARSLLQQVMADHPDTTAARLAKEKLASLKGS